MKLRDFEKYLPIAILFVAACGNGAKHEPEPGQVIFPSDYQSSYTLVYDCRQSGDHDLMNVRMLADEAALGPYRDREESFPEGAVVLKEQYDFGDPDCQGDIQLWTVMEKLAEGSSPETLDWRWQSVDADRKVTNQNDSRCTSCHSVCGVPPDGYEGTCVIP